MAVLWTGQTTGPAVNPVCLEGALPQRAGARVGRRTALGPGLLAAGPAVLDATPVERPAPVGIARRSGRSWPLLRGVAIARGVAREPPRPTGRGRLSRHRRRVMHWCPRWW